MRRWVMALVVGAIAVPATATAQDGKGFLFRPPTAAITLRGGVTNATGHSDLFDFVTDTLTLGRKDFGGASFGVDLAIGTSRPWLDVVLGAGYASASASSDYADFEDNAGNPIA